MMRHPVALYLQVSAHANDGQFELFERTKRRPRRQLFGFVRRFTRPESTEVGRETLSPSGSAA